MRWLKHTISLLLVVAAVVVALATVFSDHSADYGKVALPQGGTVQLPRGNVTVYDKVHGGSTDGTTNGTFSFQVIPADGGAPLSLGPVSQTFDYGLVRSESIGQIDAVAKLKVPSSGDYVVRGSTSGAPASVSLEFGTNAGTAVLHRWKLLAGLLFGALLLALIPVPRSGRRWGSEDQPTGWSSDPRAPYAG
jgi:hypothetical protein